MITNCRSNWEIGAVFGKKKSKNLERMKKIGIQRFYIPLIMKSLSKNKNRTIIVMQFC